MEYAQARFCHTSETYVRPLTQVERDVWVILYLGPQTVEEMAYKLHYLALTVQVAVQSLMRHGLISYFVPPPKRKPKRSEPVRVHIVPGIWREVLCCISILTAFSLVIPALAR